MLYGWKENSMLANCLAAYTHLSSTVSQFFEPQVQKIAVFTYHSQHFVSPGDALRSSRNMLHGRKDNSMVPDPSQYVNIYLQSFNSELNDA